MATPSRPGTCGTWCAGDQRLRQSRTISHGTHAACAVTLPRRSSHLPPRCAERSTGRMCVSSAPTSKRRLAAWALLLAYYTSGLAAGQLWTDATPELPSSKNDLFEGMDMRCKGDEDYVTACLIRDLYFDTKTNTFLVFGRKIGSAATDSAEDITQHFDEQTCVVSQLLVAHRSAWHMHAHPAQAPLQREGATLRMHGRTPYIWPLHCVCRCTGYAG